MPASRLLSGCKRYHFVIQRLRFLGKNIQQTFYAFLPNPLLCANYSVSDFSGRMKANMLCLPLCLPLDAKSYRFCYTVSQVSRARYSLPRKWTELSSTLTAKNGTSKEFCWNKLYALIKKKTKFSS
jgi:hypothetical protein